MRASPLPPHPTPARTRFLVRGTVQGVGFRPFVYRLAGELALDGWIRNTPAGVVIEVEGPLHATQTFPHRLRSECPPNSRIDHIDSTPLPPTGLRGFEIRTSDESGPLATHIPPDLATCPDCLRELFDPANRRYRHPFITCTHCGPRFSIVHDLPYDRANTSMRAFPLCPDCHREYTDPLDRRFHAEPIACPNCGPKLQLQDPQRRTLATADDALRQTSQALRLGQIVALKGIGGFHLLTDARNPDAVTRLRQRKQRETKPLAVLFPNLASVAHHCSVSPLEANLLASPAAPIVLLRRLPNTPSHLAESIAPGVPDLGVLLPYSPIHHLLMADLGFPVVATSGNLSDEPLCTDNTDALNRLADIADLFLLHNREIIRPVDDSVARVLLDGTQILRRSRGFAPAPLPFVSEHTQHGPILALGAGQKSTIAWASDHDIVLSQHIGDLDTAPARTAYLQIKADLPRFHRQEPRWVVSDLHPDYPSTQAARDHVRDHPDCRWLQVQHHHAHVLSCLADHGRFLPALGVAWDGTGLGPDGTAWGGEFLRVTNSDPGFERIAHLRPFPLPGGDQASREPRRSALGLLYARFGDELFGLLAHSPGIGPALQSFTPEALRVFHTTLRHGAHAPHTTSAGRLFDAVASMTGLIQIQGHEGQAAAALELAATRAALQPPTPYPFGLDLNRPKPWLLDWAPMIDAILDDLARGVAHTAIAARFHETLAAMIVAVARASAESTIALTGGCFQNRLLTERTVTLLTQAGLNPLIHRSVPPNDGGIALGQIVAARHLIDR